ncbi:MAG: hypothetical protein AAGB10_23255 [Pseudomonadota bacterium]
MGYIDGIATEADSLQPDNPIARAISDHWLSAANSNLLLHAFNNFAFMHKLAPTFDPPVDEELLKDSKAKTADYLDILEYAVTSEELGKDENPHLEDILTGATFMPLKSFN